MKSLLMGALGLVLCISFAGVDAAWAQSDVPRLALHAQAPAAKNKCTDATPNGQGLDCTQYEVDQLPSSMGTIYNVYLAVGFGSTSRGVAGLSCGIVYPSAAFFVGWTLCADLEFKNAGPGGEWPNPTGGNRITWTSTTNCQTTEINGNGVHAVAGYFYVYCYGSDGLFELTPNQNVGSGAELQVSDCDASVVDLPSQAAGNIGFGTLLGYDPCSATPVQETTWGSLKQQFGSE